VDESQCKEDVPARAQFFRHISKGGWPFSTNDHGWPISDCTAEGLKVALGVRKHAAELGLSSDQLLAPERLYDAVNVILSFQNADGGWATYENTRGGSWYEWLNPAEVFGDIMIDYTYVECSSACITALASFAEQFPGHRRGEVQGALVRGKQFLCSLQRPDGSFYGSWAVCFTYAAWFAAEGLRATGEPEDSSRLRRLSSFLLSKQNEDGGWGETYLSCVTKEYHGCESLTVNTAWALLALMKAGCTDVGAVKRGIDYLTAKQLEDGNWAQEKVSGIFNRTCGITYTAYRNCFPIWALGVYDTEYAPRASDLRVLHEERRMQSESRRRAKAASPVFALLCSRSLAVAVAGVFVALLAHLIQCVGEWEGRFLPPKGRGMDMAAMIAVCGCVVYLLAFFGIPFSLALTHGAENPHRRGRVLQ
jgi:squalene/oxidosqualene cyclase-like protein